MIVSAALDDIEGKNTNVIDKNRVTRETKIEKAIHGFK